MAGLRGGDGARVVRPSRAVGCPPVPFALGGLGVCARCGEGETRRNAVFGDVGQRLHSLANRRANAGHYDVRWSRTLVACEACRSEWRLHVLGKHITRHEKRGLALGSATSCCPRESAVGALGSTATSCQSEPVCRCGESREEDWRRLPLGQNPRHADTVKTRLGRS
jgi:hypothetical protein